ncbi:MAG: TrkA family potassium uptake protein [Spirochaetaceae bacterium]|nr:MAG: TrkA family potassium uptake protein [Spirochaetaceae bacterium]
MEKVSTGSRGTSKRTTKERQRVFAVLGLGVFGRQICETLAERGASVIAIDQDPGLVEQVKEDVTQAILVDTTDEDSLSQAALQEVDVAVVAMGDNVEASILTTALLKKQGVAYVVARAISALHARVLKQVGADEILNLETDAGTRLASRLIAPDILEQVALSSDISLAEMYVPQAVLGATLAELDLRGRYNITVISIKRTTRDVDELGNPVENEQIVFPGPNDTLLETDVIHVVGKNDAIESFRRL